MTTQQATFFILKNLRNVYPEGEADRITDWVMESLTGSRKAERMLYKNASVTHKEELQLRQFVERLMQHEPVQYVLNEAWFCGLKFYVDRNVLIPRPETEELVDWVIKEIGGTKSDIRIQEHDVRNSQIRILDIGTGSGCIPIALKKKLPGAEVWSCDASEAALNVARKNTEKLDVNVHFLLLDFLKVENQKELPSFNIIVSNPPYVPEKEKQQMQPNVLNYEPHTALFVPDNDGLVFYKAIADFGIDHLYPGGTIYTELHEDLGFTVSDVFKSKGYVTRLKKDMQGKDRMLKARS